MGRNIGPVCKLCRREGSKLYLKGDRCNSMKCAIEKRNYPPGMHHWRRGKLSEYAKRLREKQRAKRYYGLFETQFKNYFLKALKKKGNTGTNLLVLLESRLDNVLFRGGFALSRVHARQMINHGHLAVNGKKVDIPSFLVKQGDIIQAVDREDAKKMLDGIAQAINSNPPSWIERGSDPLSLKVVNLPVREEIQIDLQEQLIVEFFSR